MANRAEGVAEVYVNDSQAQNALKELAQRAAALNDKLNEMRKANDKLGFDKAKKELDGVNKEMQSYRKTVFDVQKVLNNLSGTSYNNLVKAQRTLSKEIRNMNRESKEEIALYNQKVAQLKRVDAEMDKVRRDMRTIGTETNTFGNIIKKVGPWMAATFSIGAITGFVRQVIQVRQEFEKYEAVLTNTLGSKSAAQQSLKMIQDFAAKTPFQVTELTGAFVKLTNMGFKPTREEMRKLGDLASSTGKGFDQLAEAIIDAQTGEFERLKEFGVRAQKEGDKVTFTFKGVKQQVDFTNESIKNYITGLGDLQGVSGSMAAISATLGGKISNLGDAWDSLLNTIGKMTGGFIGDLIKGFSDLVGWTEKLIAVPASESLEKERMEVNLLFNSITSLNEGNEARGRLLGELQQKYPEYLGNLDLEKVTNEELLKLQKQINDQFLTKIKLAVYEEDIQKLMEKGRIARQKEVDAIKQINYIYDTYITNKKEGLTIDQKAQAILEANLGNFGSTATMYGNIENSVAGVKGEIKNAQQDITDSQKLQNDLASEYNQILVEQISLMAQNPGVTATTSSITSTKTVNTRQNFSVSGLQPLEFSGVIMPPTEEVTQALLEFKQTVIENLEGGEEGTIIEKILGLDDENYEGTLGKISMWNSLFQEEFGKINQIITNVENGQLQKYLESNDKKKKALKKRLDAGLISQEQYNKQVNALDEEADKKRRKMEHDQAVRSKALALTDAVIKGALAVLNALNTNPFLPMGPIMAGIAAALSAIQIGVIASQPVPQAAKGKYDVIGASDGRTYSAGWTPGAQTGIYHQPTLIGGLGLVGEHAPELVVDGMTTRNIQMNAPGLLQAIDAMRVPQFAAGKYPTSGATSSETQTQTQLAGMIQADSMVALLQQISAKLDNPTRAAIVYSDIEDAQTEVNNIKTSVSK
jgi:hypothetical protein